MFIIIIKTGKFTVMIETLLLICSNEQKKRLTLSPRTPYATSARGKTDSDVREIEALNTSFHSNELNF